jgi:hypothetical protein
VLKAQAIVAAVVVAVSGTVVNGSAYVFFRSPSSIVLGTDSLAQTQSDTGLIFSTTCKIHSSGRWWTVAGGFFGTRGAASFDLVNAIDHDLASARTLADVRREIEQRVYPALYRAVEAQRHSPAFRALYGPGSVLTQITVGGVNDYDTVLRLGAFTALVERIEPSLMLKTMWFQCPGNWCPDGRVLDGGTVAETGPLMKALQAPRADWVERGDAAAAARLIREQITATPNEVGGPIDVLEITVTGARWIDPDPASRCR